MAAGDCELRDEWFLEQDVNSWTSLGFTAVGIALAVGVAGGRLPRAFLGLATVVAVEGVGSLLYHGTSSDVAGLLHDVPLVGMAGFLVGWHVGRLTAGSDRGSVIGLVAGVALGILLEAAPEVATTLTVILAVTAIVVTESMARARGMSAVWTPAPAGLLAIGVTAWTLGRTGGPGCAPDSPLQMHALWHLLGAAVLLLWASRAAQGASTQTSR